jgi:phosphatidylglycerol:prolipoprotein diacylglycerol transferase
MIREVFSIGPITITPYGLMLVAAFFLAFLQLRWGLRQLRAGDDEDANAVLFAAGVGGILGGKIYYVLLKGDWRLLFERFGFVWYGGFILGTLAVLWTIHRRRLSPWSAADAAAPALALGYAVGRIGCFLVGDDYGVPTQLPWGIAFPVGLPPTSAGALRAEFGLEIPSNMPDHQLLTVHPTQLYETLICGLIWLIGVRMLRLRLVPGTTVLTVVALLLSERLLVEFLRAKDDRLLASFTVAQLISGVSLVIVVGLWSARHRWLRAGPPRP